MNNQYRSSPIPLGEVTGTIGAMILERAARWPDQVVFADREGPGYEPVSWGTLLADVISVVDFLYARGIGKGDRAAVLSPNSYAMLCWELAVASMGAISVPIFSGYAARHIDYILGHVEPTAILIDGEERLSRVEACEGLRRIKTVVTLQESGYTRFEECLAGGSEGLFSRLTAGVEPADVAFIQYTSGTTGDPKGVMLTHRNLVSQRKATEKIWEIPPRSRFLSYLPWHHSYGGLSERFTALYHGAAMYLEDSYGKDIHRLIENWRLVKPTHFFSVPRIYMALVTEAKLDARTQETLFHPGLEFVFTAAAPLPRECGEYFDAQRVPVLEGWGMTETSPTVTITPGDRKRVHSYVGDPIPGCEIRITGEDEILVRGPNVMKGYYKDPEKTAGAVDSEGWLHTGDIGELTDLGLKLKYRRDGLFKLANGEKVSAVLVENALVNASPWISQAVVFGSGESFTAALLFPNFPRLEEWAADCHRELPKGWELSADREIQELFRRDIEESMRELEPAYLRVKAFVVVPEELSVEKGQLTPSLKVVRHRVAKEYRDWVHAIYRPGKHPHRQACIVGGKDDAFYWKKN